MRRLLFIMVLLALLAMPLMASGAEASDIALTRYSGADYDVYVPDSIQTSDMLIVVNYAEDSDLTLLVTGHQYTLGTNRTYLTHTVAAQSSALVEVTFLDVETNYTIALIMNGATVFSIGRDVGGFYLPVDNDSWSWTPNDDEEEEADDGAVYTVDDWLMMLANITLETLAITTLVVSAGVCIGCGVKAWTKFLVPMDLASYALYAFIVLDVVFQFTGDWDRLWYLPLLVGYVMGFFLWHVPYIMPMLIDSESKTLTVRPQVIYYPEDRNKPCIQAQTNRALLARWLGIHHELRTDGPMAPDWSMSIKKPYWPMIRSPGMWVQKSVTEKETVEKAWIRWAKLRTRYILANASKMPYYLWLQSTKAFYDLTDRLEYSENARVRETLTRAAETTAKASDLITHSQHVSHHEAIGVFLQKADGAGTADLNEHELNVIEDAATDVPEETDQAEIMEEERQESKEAPREAETKPKGARKGKRKVKE